MSLSAGVLTLGKLTPGVVSSARCWPRSRRSRQPYRHFRWVRGSHPLVWDVSGFAIDTAAVQPQRRLAGDWLRDLSAFAGIVADPVQRRLGLHQRRLRRMIDVMERRAGPRCTRLRGARTVMWRACSMCSIWSPQHTDLRVERFAAHPNSRRGTEAISSTIPERLSNTRMSRRNPASLNRA